MFFPKLTRLKERFNIPNDIINKLDTWLGMIPKYQRSGFTSDFFAREYNIDYTVTEEIFLNCVEIGLLSINYDVYCPSCDEIAYSASVITDIPEFVRCDNGHLFSISKHSECLCYSYNLIESPSTDCKKKLKLTAY